MNGFSRGFVGIVTALILITSFVAIAQAEAPAVIKFGCAISFTEKESRTGKLYRDSYDLALKTINKNGGIRVGQQAYQAKIIYYDDRSDPVQSARMVEKLITEDKVNFLLGPYSSEITIPDSLVAQRYRIPMIAGGGASGKIFSQNNPYIFGTLPPAGQYFQSTLKMIQTFRPAPKTIAILYSNDKFDASVAEGTNELAKEMGFQVVMLERYAVGATDFKSILHKINDLNAEVILLGGHSEEALAFTRQAKELNVCPKLISMTVGPSESNFRKSLAHDADYIYGVASWSPQMNFRGYLLKDAQEFTRLFKNEYNYDPDYHCASGFIDMAIFKAAIEKAGTLNPVAVRNAIASISLDTIGGHVEFSANGQIKGTSVVLQILQHEIMSEGEVYQVYPNGERRAVYPFPCWNDRQTPTSWWSR